MAGVARTKRGSQRASTRVVPRPFLKWVGGKGQLLPELVRAVEAAGEFGGYHEPFVGGGALFFELYRTGKLAGKCVRLSDNNERLIETYQVVKDDLDTLIPLLRAHQGRHDRDYYYEMRAHVPATPIERAARIVYLNKTCFNGLYRENSRGLFNVPMGKYDNPRILDKENLRGVSAALAEVRIECRPFEAIAEFAEAGDLVYFDPPYDPVSTTSSFTSYHKDEFAEDAQRRLAATYALLANRGVKVLLSNSNTSLIRELYSGFVVEIVEAKRSVNSKGGLRGKVEEVLVRNF